MPSALIPILIGGTAVMAVLLALDFLVYRHIFARIDPVSKAVNKEKQMWAVKVERITAAHAQAKAELEEQTATADQAITENAELKAKLSSHTDLLDQTSELAKTHRQLEASQAAVTERERQLVIAVHAIQRLRDDHLAVTRDRDEARRKLALIADLQRPADKGQDANVLDSLKTETQHVPIETRSSPTATSPTGFTNPAPGATPARPVVIGEAHPAALASASTLDDQKPLLGLSVVPGLNWENQQKLQAAGVTTLRQLAMTSPAQVREIVGAQAWESINIENWVRHAARLEFGIG